MSGVLQDLISALSLGSLYALLALGIALIFGVMKLINFAHGQLIMVGGYTMFVLGDVPFVVLAAGCLIVVVIFALLVERVAFRPIRDADPSTLLITSFAVSFLLQNLAVVTLGTRAKAVSFPDFFSENFELGSLRIEALSVITVFIAMVLLGGLLMFLRTTMLGIQMRAAAEDFTTTRLMGVRADVVIATAFGISGLLAGTAAVVLVAQGGTITPLMGVTPVVIAFIATVVGGMGSLLGAVIGGYLLGSLTVVLQVALPVDLRPYRDAFVFLTVILVLVLRPRGLIVPRSEEVRS